MQAKLIPTIAVALIGCATERTLVEKCDALVDTLCDRGVQCIGGTHSECVQALQADLPCGSVKAVSASYDRCIDQLEAASCSSLFPRDMQGQPELRLPADCMHVVLSRTTSAPSSTIEMPPTAAHHEAVGVESDPTKGSQP